MLKQRFINWKTDFVYKKNHSRMDRQPYFDIAVAYIPRERESVILDIGCGDTSFFDQLNINAKFKNIYPLDGNPATVKIVKQKYPKAQVYSAPDKLKFQNSSVDFIHCSHLIEHLSSSELYILLKEIDRVLKDGGKLVISSPLLWEGFYNDLSHLKPYNPDVITSYLCSGGQNRTLPVVSDKYVLKQLSYRYNVTNVGDEMGSHYAVIDIFIKLFLKILRAAGFRKYEKNAYTLVLEKQMIPRKLEEEIVEPNNKATTCIVIPTYNQEDYTIKCFESIGKNTEDYLLIWVDDGSTEASRTKVLQAINKSNINYKRIFLPENLGFVKAINAGIEKALAYNSKYIVLENNDTIVTKGWLNSLILGIKTNKNLGAVGPLTNSAAWQTADRAIKLFPELEKLPLYNGDYNSYTKKVSQLYNSKVFVSEEIKMLSFFSVLIKSQVFKEIGLFSEDYGIGYGEDDDFCFRLRRAGYILGFMPGIFVFHNHMTTFKSLYTDEEMKKMKETNFEILQNNIKKYLKQ